MFNKEICVEYNGIRIAWYPLEKVCLVISKRSNRIYNKIPKKYRRFFKDKDI